MMIRRTLTALLVALVASFALSSPADAAQKKTARAKHSSRATAGATKTKPTVKKKRAVRKKAGAKSGATAKKSVKKVVKRQPTTKPH